MAVARSEHLTNEGATWLQDFSNFFFFFFLLFYFYIKNNPAKPDLGIRAQFPSTSASSGERL